MFDGEAEDPPIKPKTEGSNFKACTLISMIEQTYITYMKTVPSLFTNGSRQRDRVSKM